MTATRRWVHRFIRSSEEGQSLALFASGLIGLLGLVGMSVDVGMLLQTRADLQKSADAAAFAAAQDLPDTELATTTTGEYVSSNGGDETGWTVEFANTDAVTVTTSRDIEYTFLSVLGLQSSTVTATATVEVGVVTGYAFDDSDVFPYAVWGGAVEGDGSAAGGSDCAYGICIDSEQVFRSNHYEADTMAATPDWDVNGNSFKGYFHAGGDVVHIGPDDWQTFSKGGNAIGQEPIDALLWHASTGHPILVPVISEAFCEVGCGTIEFKIVAWVALMLDPNFDANPDEAWTGTVVEDYAISKGSTEGSAQPPAELATLTYLLTE